MHFLSVEWWWILLFFVQPSCLLPVLDWLVGLYAEKCTNYCWSSCLCLDNLDVDVETIAGSKGYVLASLFLFCGGGQCLTCNRKGLNGDNPFKWSDSQRRECDFNRPRSTYFFPLPFFSYIEQKEKLQLSSGSIFQLFEVERGGEWNRK
jgi:hypothetical protein